MITIPFLQDSKTNTWGGCGWYQPVRLASQTEVCPPPALPSRKDEPPHRQLPPRLLPWC